MCKQSWLSMKLKSECGWGLISYSALACLVHAESFLEGTLLMLKTAIGADKALK